MTFFHGICELYIPEKIQCAVTLIHTHPTEEMKQTGKKLVLSSFHKYGHSLKETCCYQFKNGFDEIDPILYFCYLNL